MRIAKTLSWLNIDSHDLMVAHCKNLETREDFDPY